MCLFPIKRYGFTGTRNFSETNEESVKHVLTVLQNLKLEKATEFTTGACRGIDDFVFRMCYAMFPNGWHRVIVPANRSQVIIPEPAENLQIIYMPEGTTYKDRNNRILDYTDELHAFPHDKRRIRSGTFQTINLAKKRKIPFQEHILYE